MSSCTYFGEIELTYLGNSWAGGKETGKHRASNARGPGGLAVGRRWPLWAAQYISGAEIKREGEGSFQQLLLCAVNGLHDCGRLEIAAAFWLSD